MPSSPQFEFYEKVRVYSSDEELQEINQELGAVLGRVQCDEGNWRYAVHIYRDSECWDVVESDLHSTGEHDCPETFFDGTSIKVSEDGELLE
jgi:hypothetical protein